MAGESASLLQRALGSSVEPPTDETSERILDAALDLSAASGVRHLTMDEVAERERRVEDPPARLVVVAGRRRRGERAGEEAHAATAAGGASRATSPRLSCLRRQRT